MCSGLLPGLKRLALEPAPDGRKRFGAERLRRSLSNESGKSAKEIELMNHLSNTNINIYINTNDMCSGLLPGLKRLALEPAPDGRKRFGAERLRRSLSNESGKSAKGIVWCSYRKRGNCQHEGEKALFQRR